MQTTDRRSIRRSHDLATVLGEGSWDTLGAEPELSGEDIGRVATAVEMAARIALAAVKGDPIDPEDRAVLERMLTPRKRKGGG